MAGFRELLAVEWEQNAVDNFRLNFPEVPVYHGDIKALSVEDCLARIGLRPGELDVLDGSPPCQGFSTAGSRKMEDPRNGLFREFVRLLRGLQPRVFVMENVSGMVKGKMRLIFVDILRELKSCGYRSNARLLNAQYFSVPQSRQRIIFVGVREDVIGDPSFPKPEWVIGVRSVLDMPKETTLRRGWGKVQIDGVKNAQFQNDYRSLNLPCCTLEKTRPPILRINGIERELTLEESSIIGSFPSEWRWGPRAYQRIGNSVPPLFMRAIARNLRTNILDLTQRSSGE